MENLHSSKQIGRVVKFCALSETRFYRKFGLEVFHLLLHLIDLSGLPAYSPLIVQLLMWLPAPKRVHKGHFFFVHSAFWTHALQHEHLCISWVLASLSCKHRCHAQKVHLLSLCCRIAWNQMKAAFGNLMQEYLPAALTCLGKWMELFTMLLRAHCALLAEISSSFLLDLPDWMSVFYPSLWSPSN